ncbi:MAG: response regulator [Candidatus Aureabacteria bacterium]|nr:response regulator [Candidatus Auribacterota bacterium]
MESINKKDFKILIVDDEESIVNFLKATMEDEGFTVLQETNSQAVMDKCKNSSPHLVILDVKMPVMSGLEVLENIRAWDKKYKILAIFISAYGSEMTDDDKKLLEKLEVKDFIPKGVSLFEAKERIFKVIKDKYKIV